VVALATDIGGPIAWLRSRWRTASGLILVQTPMLSSQEYAAMVCLRRFAIRSGDRFISGALALRWVSGQSSRYFWGGVQQQLLMYLLGTHLKRSE